MSDYKEFTGKTLDEAIKEACKHFDLERNKLEIEIISGGSSGIFGLVGRKNAVVKARPRAAMTFAAAEAQAGREQKRGEKKPRREARPRERAEEKPKGLKPEPKEPREAKGRKPKPSRPAKAETRPAPKGKAEVAVKPKADVAVKPKAEAAVREEKAPRPAYETPAAPAAEEKPLENEKLAGLIREAVGMMIEPIIGEAPIEVLDASDRIKVVIDDEDQAGLLIGREGQTLNALQYLINRIVAKQWEEPVKVQLDTGMYRERQDDKLRQMALYLADRARTLGRPQSTRPLSSYHRRVVHLALQDDASVQTRSKGDGPLKRVLILPKREKGGKPQA